MASVLTTPPATQPQDAGERRHGNMPMNMVTSYNFYQIDPAFRRLPAADRETALTAFYAAVAAHQERHWIRAYSTFGLREDADFFFWSIAKEVEAVQDFTTELYRTPLGPYLTMTHTFVAVSKESEYTKEHEHPPLKDIGETKYLFVYPFVKTRAWYLLPFPERMRLMKAHIDTGHEFPDVRINTAYSFGIDDQDFVVAFDGNSLEEFVRLVMKLRETEASAYTERDTPMFIGLRKPIHDVMASLGLF